jgi:hypothetical protein
MDADHTAASSRDTMAADATAARLARLRSKPWDGRDLAVPPQVFDVPGMLWYQERRMLYYLARHDFAGAGVIADLGTYLGSSTMCFAAGLRDRSVDQPVLHTFDLFKLGDFGAEIREFPGEPPADLRTRGVFEENLRDYLDLIVVHEGDILAESWDDEPIELLFVDIAKSHKVLDHLLLTFFPALLPGRSLIVMQDYLWGTSGPWHHIVMEKLSDHLEYVVDTDVASMVFLLKREIPRSVLEQCLYMSIPRDEKLELMDKAIAKLDTPEKQQYLIENRELLLSGKDESWGLHYHKR